ncbi:MAG: hypothetical protein BWY28_01961 [bacterium ADurb.Bin236]|nr:MAG: hypothetical protein BWY28_01961 [bacterium ADurb.Bin236]
MNKYCFPSVFSVASIYFLIPFFFNSPEIGDLFMRGKDNKTELTWITTSNEKKEWKA